MLAAIALGSNLPSPFGEPAQNLQEATRRLGQLGQVRSISSFHATEPIGFVAQPRFLNAALLLETPLSPVDLLHQLLTIERSMGRQRSSSLPPKGPRIIDLDLLLARDAHGNDLTEQLPVLVLPHPEMHRRSFVLDPLAEIAPDWLHPLLGASVASLRDRLREIASAGNAAASA